MVARGFSDSYAITINRNRILQTISNYTHASYFPVTQMDRHGADWSNSNERKEEQTWKCCNVT